MTTGLPLSRAGWRILGPSFALLLLLLCSCQGAGKSPVSELQDAASRLEAVRRIPVPARPAESPLLLPDPAQLDRMAAAAPGQRLLDGADFDGALPSGRVSASGTALSFAPTGASLANVAFAIYHFDLPGYSGEGSVQTNWGSSAPAAGSFFIGVADYAGNAWRWFTGDTANPLLLPEGLDFLSPGEQCYIAVCLSGSSAHELQSLRLGSDMPPTAALMPEYEVLSTGAEMYLDAGASSDDFGIVLYEWDLDGNGSFETSTGTVFQAECSFATGGQHTVSVRVSDTAGQSATSSATVTVDLQGYDEVEPNNDPAGANVLPALSFQGFEGNVGAGGYDGGSEDFYALSIEQPCRLNFELTGLLFDAYTSVELRDSSGITPFAFGEYDGFGISLTNRFDPPGDYYLVVLRGENGNVDYELKCHAQLDLAYDEVEPNDSRAAANVLPQVVSGFSGNLGQGGYDGSLVDYFSFSPQAGRYYDFNFQSYNLQANLELEVEDANGTSLGGATAEPGADVFGLVFSSSATVYLRVDQIDEALIGPNSDYTLRIIDRGEAPQVGVVATPDNGTRPLAVQLDASGSVIPTEQGISSVTWDLNDDGFEDLFGGAELLQVSTIYFRNKTYSPRVTITLDSGAIGQGSTDVIVSGASNEVEPNNNHGSEQALPGMPFSGFLGDVGVGGYDGGNEDLYKFTTAGAGIYRFELGYEQLYANNMYLAIATWNNVSMMYEIQYGVPDDDLDGNIILDANLSAGTEYILALIVDDGGPASGYELSASAP
ncbi:PKD domain-containing protein [bacterium]|nr:PKD domain-containing protein [bacterium]